MIKKHGCVKVSFFRVIISHIERKRKAAIADRTSLCQNSNLLCYENTYRQKDIIEPYCRLFVLRNLLE